MGASRPIDQFKVGRKAERQRGIGIRRLVGEIEQALDGFTEILFRPGLAAPTPRWDTLLNRREIRVLRRFSHAGPNRVEVHIGHGRQHRGLVQKRLAFEAAFPEPPRTAVLGIGLTGDGFVQTAHEPGKIMQPPAVFLIHADNCVVCVSESVYPATKLRTRGGPVNNFSQRRAISRASQPSARSRSTRSTRWK